MFDHQTAILHDLNARPRQRFGGWLVANTGLKPHGFRFLGQNIIYVAIDILRASKDINKIDFPRNVNQAPIDRDPKDLCDLGVINRDRNNFEAGSKQILRHVHRWLTRLRFCLDTENGNAAGFHNQLSDLRPAFDQILFPVHVSSITTDMSTSDAGFRPSPLDSFGLFKPSSLIQVTFANLSRTIARVYDARINGMKTQAFIWNSSR
jgi:hypothetical protein